MTTLAWDGEILASDGCAASEDTIVQGGVRKIYVVDGGMVGFAGSLGNGLAFVEWLRKGADASDKPKLDDDFCGIFVNTSGRATEYDSNLYSHRAGKPAAIGSGAAAALGAMLAGKNATEAVRIACKIDPNSRPPIRSYALDKV